MKKLVVSVFILCALYAGITQGQTSTMANTGGTGWKRIAQVTGNGGRGFGTVSIYVSSDIRPIAMTIEWFHDWGVNGGISLRSNTRDKPYWSSARITDDGTNSYIEVYFNTHIAGLSILSDDYGWRVATPYSGTLPDGGGTIRANAVNSRFSIEEMFVVLHNSNVGIGTTTPQAKLAVNGNILANEIKVKTDISVPDYVFEPDYELLPLTEVAAYVKEHKHLPEIPSAADIGRDGLDLAEMNLLLLKKVEELTLHQINLLDELNRMRTDLDLLLTKHKEN